MTVATFGLARPLNYNDLAEGMIVLAAPGQGQQYFGVVAKLRHDFILVTLSASDGDVPGALDLSNCPADLWLIPGTLEVEPASRPFVAGSRNPSGDGFRIDSLGNISACFMHRDDFAQKARLQIDLRTGVQTRGEGPMAEVGGLKWFIRQEGRKDRFEWPDLTSEQ